jgi:hypothetical protein
MAASLVADLGHTVFCFFISSLLTSDTEYPVGGAISAGMPSCDFRLPRFSDCICFTTTVAQEVLMLPQFLV